MIYEFKTELEKDKFYKDLNKCVKSFSKQHKNDKKKAMWCSSLYFRQKRNENKNHLDYTLYFNYCWFWEIINKGYYNATEEELNYYKY